jgi:hypothetical protein
MRKLLVGLGLLLLVSAAGTFGYRWLSEPARYARNQSHAPGAWRGYSEPRAEPRQRDGGWRSPSGGGGGGLRGLRLFEIVVDLLNIVIGAAGICLAVMGLRMQRAGQRSSLRTDA